MPVWILTSAMVYLPDAANSTFHIFMVFVIKLIIVIYSLEFFTSPLADGLSLEFK